MIERPDATENMRAWLEVATAFLRRLSPRDIANRRPFRPDEPVRIVRAKDSGGGIIEPLGTPTLTTAGPGLPWSGLPTSLMTQTVFPGAPATGGGSGTAEAAFGLGATAALMTAPSVSFLKGVPASAFIDEFGNSLIDRWWVQVSGSWSEADAALTCSGAGSICFSGNTVTNGFASVDMVSPTTGAGHEVYLRCDAALANGYTARIVDVLGQPGVEVNRMTGGVRVQLGVVILGGLADGDVLKLEGNGTALKGYINAVEQINVVDATYTSGVSGLGCAAAAGFRTFINSTVV